MEPQRFTLKQRARSFGFAFAGIRDFFRTQHNAVIHAIATVAVVISGFAIGLDGLSWLFISWAIGLVWAAELFNTAIERLCDVVSPQKNPNIKFVKDVAAAAVLITAIIAVITGCIVFVPKLI